MKRIVTQAKSKIYNIQADREKLAILTFFVQEILVHYKRFSVFIPGLLSKAFYSKAKWK